MRVRTRPASNEALVFELRRTVQELELHQLELELQNRSLREEQLALEESRARYADLYDNAPTGHLTLDRFGVVTELNLATAALLRTERRSIVGSPLRLFLAPGSRRALDVHLKQAFVGRRPSSVELAIARADETPRMVELLTVPSRREGARAPEAAAVLHAAMIDVSERDRAVRKRDEPSPREPGAAVAETANRLEQQLLGVVSHELRSPLAPMLLWARALRSADLAEDLRARALDAIESCIDLQTRMIDDLIDLARSERGELRLERQRLDLRAVVQAAVDLLAPAAAAKELDLTVETAAEPLWVVGDPTRLGQVVSSLLSNALTATPALGRIALSVRAGDGEAVLVLRHDGYGGPRFADLFEPPGQAREPATPRSFARLDLGSSLARRLVAQHGGTITAESAGAGGGSSFTVTLPRAPADTRR
ncbi:MAG TPA: HAMP domain-containing sensor histidine kinase [Polyangia bacterium]|nr:HAMP domain-containing sensor histidine kinase [Polyangia bacterium]